MNGLTEQQRKALADYATLRIGLRDLLASLGGAIEATLAPDERRFVFHYDNRHPIVHVGPAEIREAMDKHARGEVSTKELSDWAAMLLANPSYDWEGENEDEIAGWLNEISLLSLKPRARQGEGESE
jgi:hypothetical protein